MPNAIKEILQGDETTQFPAVNGTCDITTGADLGSAVVVYIGGDNAGNVQLDFEAVPAIGTGNIAVASVLNDDSDIVGFQLTFQGALANTAIAPFTVDSELNQAATVSAVTTQDGATGSPSTVTPTLTTIQFADGVSTPQLDQIAFSAGALAGTMTLAYFSQSSTFDAAVSTASDIQTWIQASVAGSGAVTGDWSAGFLITYLDGGFFGSYSVTISASSLTGANTGGQPQIFAVTTAANAGSLTVNAGGVQSTEFNATDSTPGALAGYTGGGSAGAWNYTAQANADSVSVSAAQGISALTAPLGAVMVEVQVGGGGGDSLQAIRTPIFPAIRNICNQPFNNRITITR